jgi:shikimate kinase
LESDQSHLIFSLIGLPGSGKSTVGRQLARRLQIPFIDTDQVIEQRIGCTVREFFEQEGEDRFRNIEVEIIDSLTRENHCVLATGGGVVVRQENREILHSRSKVVYLKSTPEELFRRLKYDSNRPLLQVEDPLKKLQELYSQRERLYRETAHFVIETGRPSVATLVNMILMQLELAGIKLSGER